MKNILLLIAVAINVTAFAQSIAINTDGSNPDSSAILDIKSTAKGLLMPRLSKAQRDAITNPANGLMIYQTDNTPGLYSFNTTGGWALLGDNFGTHVAAKDIDVNGFRLFNTDPKTYLSISPAGSLRLKTRLNYGSEINVEKFVIDSAGGFFIRGDLGIGGIPIEGAGYRTMWHPYKAAFRSGYADATSWNEDNVGFFSWAGGHIPKASGLYSFAFGDQNIASNTSSIAFGTRVTVTGGAGFAAGSQNTVGGTFGVAFGWKATADGRAAVALGYRVSALGDHSVALGQGATSNGFMGTMVMGDASTPDSVRNSANHQFAARYSGGYKFFTNSASSIGVQLTPSAASWSSISDSTKKEKFVSANTDVFLKKLRSLKLGSWNYKGQDAEQYRHYGPMAQEIFAAYGKDVYGTIGNDTLLASADMDGIMMIMLQGLEKRTADQQQENSRLQQELSETRMLVKKLEAQNAALIEKFATIDKLQQMIMVTNKGQQQHTKKIKNSL